MRYSACKVLPAPDAVGKLSGYSRLTSVASGAVSFGLCLKNKGTVYDITTNTHYPSIILEAFFRYFYKIRFPIL